MVISQVSGCSNHSSSRTGMHQEAFQCAAHLQMLKPVSSFKMPSEQSSTSRRASHSGTGTPNEGTPRMDLQPVLKSFKAVEQASSVSFMQVRTAAWLSCGHQASSEAGCTRLLRHRVQLQDSSHMFGLTGLHAAWCWQVLKPVPSGLKTPPAQPVDKGAPGVKFQDAAAGSALTSAKVGDSSVRRICFCICAAA